MQEEPDRADDDADVRDVEHREARPEFEREHVHHIAAEHAVEAVAQRACQQQNGHPAAKRAVHPFAANREHDDHDEDDGEDDEDPARRTGEQTEGSAGVVDVAQLQKARKEGADAVIQRDAQRDPIFQPLIGNQDQDDRNGK